jgi:hypothetical protein
MEEGASGRGVGAGVRAFFIGGPPFRGAGDCGLKTRYPSNHSAILIFSLTAFLRFGHDQRAVAITHLFSESPEPDCVAVAIIGVGSFVQFQNKEIRSCTPAPVHDQIRHCQRLVVVVSVANTFYRQVL